MATDTYSLGITGVAADNAAASQSVSAGLLDVGDSVARPGDMQSACMLGTPFLVRGLDGSQAWYTYDAERSLPGGPLVLKRYGPP